MQPSCRAKANIMNKVGLSLIWLSAHLTFMVMVITTFWYTLAWVIELPYLTVLKLNDAAPWTQAYGLMSSVIQELRG
jgi:hypothetical protein